MDALTIKRRENCLKPTISCSLVNLILDDGGYVALSLEKSAFEKFS